MYRRSVREKMEVEESQVQFLTRMGQLPVVNSTIEQLAYYYTRTKDSNSLVRMTLQTAESGVKIMSYSAQPVIKKLEKPSQYSELYSRNIKFCVFCWKIVFKKMCNVCVLLQLAQ